MISISSNDLDQLSKAADAAPRKRSNRNLHQSLDAKVQRLAIAMEPDTYVRPHRHPQTWECYLPLRGAFKVVLFDDTGLVTDCIAIGQNGLVAYELPANTWHSVLSLQKGSIIFEVKEGPYIQPAVTDTAAWSPAEGTEAVASFKRFLATVQVGQRYG